MTKETPEQAGKRLFEEAFKQAYGHSPRPPQLSSISRDSLEAKQRAGLASSTTQRELHAIREQEGDAAALAHASGMAIAACMFVAFDLKQPETAKSTINYWAERLNAISGVVGEADIRESAGISLKQ